MRDKKGNRVKDPEVVREVEPGENITLSIDSRLQYIMYRELTAAGVANNARSATAIAVDVKTGEILAMTSWPSYNPNDKKSLSNKDAIAPTFMEAEIFPTDWFADKLFKE